jgi:dUTP pyrophosphatase
MILIKAEILKRIREEQMITGFIRLDMQLQPAGFDVTLKEIQVVDDSFMGKVEFDKKSIPRAFAHKGAMHPLHHYILITNEWFNMPLDVSAQIFPRSTLTRAGAIFSSAFVDPGYHGNLHFALSPGISLELMPNARFAQVVFHRHEKTEGYSGQYQSPRSVANEVLPGIGKLFGEEKKP